MLSDMDKILKDIISYITEQTMDLDSEQYLELLERLQYEIDSRIEIAGWSETENE